MGFFHTCRHLSLDVALGALASGSMVLWLYQVNMPLTWWFALPLSVWLIYTADHLLDVYRLFEKPAHTRRHRFHQHHFKAVLGVWLVLLILGLAGVIYWGPPQLLLFGLGMGGLTALHLGLVAWVGDKESPLVWKETGVGGIYSLGIWGGIWVLHPELVDLKSLCFLLQFFFLAMINLLIFSLYEEKTDRIQGHSSLIRGIGIQASRGLVKVLALGVLLIGIVLWGHGLTSREVCTQVLYLLMLGILYVIMVKIEPFGEHERYRVWGDAVFLLPVVVYVF